MRWAQPLLRSWLRLLTEYIPEPERAIDGAFLMPIEDVFSISGRGTVVTGRVERGIINVGEEIEIIGIQRHHDNHYLYWCRDVP